MVGSSCQVSPGFGSGSSYEVWYSLQACFFGLNRLSYSLCVGVTVILNRCSLLGLEMDLSCGSFSLKLHRIALVDAYGRCR